MHDPAIPPEPPASADGEPSWWAPYASEFPCWHAWTGVNGEFYARRPGCSPPLLVSAATPGELPALIRASRWP